jgi:hypothetical protein
MTHTVDDYRAMDDAALNSHVAICLGWKIISDEYRPACVAVQNPDGIIVDRDDYEFGHIVGQGYYAYIRKDFARLGFAGETYRAKGSTQERAIVLAWLAMEVTSE